uniref:Putative secreted protein n=1 Tax=Ixodes ricinus TaxID=34613 RepID=A0A6B0UF33_IXORI
MLGGSLLSLMPTASSSCSSSFLWTSPLVASSIMTTKSAVLATAMTCRPLPLPWEAPSMIPGRSSNCMLAPLYSMTPGMQVRVVNS